MKSLSSIPYRDHELEDLGLPWFMQEFYGHFYIPINGKDLKVIASTTFGWEHVSVSTPDMCPTFKEMVEIKEIFFNPGEIVFQIFPKKENYVNFHPNCLHLWRPACTNVAIPEIKTVLNKYEFYADNLVFKEGVINDTKYSLIYAPDWPNWESVCRIKNKVFGDTEVLLYHVTKEVDLNEKKIIILWEYKKNFKLPPKELVF